MMSLKQWLDNSWIQKVGPSHAGVENLLEIARRQIADGSLQGMSPDGTFDHAYDAVRSLCELALHASGYRVTKGQNPHEHAIDSIRFTVGPEWSDLAAYFDICRRKRHKSVYERSGMVQQSDADELLAAAKKLLSGVEAWLRKEHSDLL